MSPLVLRVLVVVALAAALVGCERAYDPNPAASYEAVGVMPTAVGEPITFRLESRSASGSSLEWYDHPVLSGTCDLPGCTVDVAASENDVTVTSTTAGDAHVVLTVNDDASATVPVTIPFRQATKIMILRAPVESPAGTKYAMVPGDTQRWWVGVGDDAGPLRASKVAAETSGLIVTDPTGYPPVTCLDAAQQDIYGEGDPAMSLLCELESDAPTALDFHFSYRDLTRDEHVRVVPLVQVKTASLVTCTGQEHIVGDPNDSARVPVTIPAEQESPCTPASVVHIPFADENTFTVAARLVLADGTVALGGSSLLAVSAGGTIDAPAKTSGMILGRFGDALISVPYVLGP